jgi:large subunit ribosomal protein L9
MKIILRKDFETLGHAGDTVTVKDGFARNFLIPRGIGLVFSPKAVKVFEEEKKHIFRQEIRDQKQAAALAETLANLSVTATVAVGEEDKVFGSVTSQTVAQLLADKGYEIDKRKILLDEPIKALGVYDVALKLHKDVDAKIRVWVVKE